MSWKVLFLDDIFSELFREKLSAEHRALDDGWVSAVTDALTARGDGTSCAFEVVKSGDLHSWRELVEKEKPDVVLLDCFWPERPLAKNGHSGRHADVGLGVIPEMRHAFAGLPIVCCTLKPNEELMERAYRLGASFFLEKVPLAMPEVQRPLKYMLLYLVHRREQRWANGPMRVHTE